MRGADAGGCPADEQHLRRSRRRARHQASAGAPARAGAVALVAWVRMPSVALLGKMGAPAGDDVADGRGDGEPQRRRRPETAHPRRQAGARVRRRRAGSPSACSCSVATEPRHDLRRAHLDVHRNFALCSSPQATGGGPRAPATLGQHLGQTLSGDRVNVAVGAEHEDSHRANASHHTHTHTRGSSRARNRSNKSDGASAAVKVVQDQHDRSALRPVPQKLDGLRRTGESARLRPRGSRLRPIGNVPTQFGDDPGEIRGTRSELRAPDHNVSPSRT